jgi:nucleoside-diphosphate-sugar epimerase
MSFEEALLEAIDKGLSWLGEKEKQTIYFFLETNYNISKHDIPYRIKDFAEAIEDIFGLGAKLLEIRIMKILFTKMGYSFPYLHTKEGLEFTKYIESARINGIRPFTLVTCTQQ